MARTTTTTLAALMTLGVLGACSQTTSDTAPADAAGTTTSSTSADTMASGQTTGSSSMDSTASGSGTAGSTSTDSTMGQTGTAQQGTATAGAPVPATQADITTGATVNDINGTMIGTIASVDATGAVLSAGGQQVKLPINSFGKTSAGLVIGTTKADFDAQVAASRAAQPGAGSAPSTPPPAGGAPTTPPQ